MTTADAAEVRNHWYWRPGWSVGTRLAAEGSTRTTSARLTHLQAHKGS